MKLRDKYHFPQSYNLYQTAPVVSCFAAFLQHSKRPQMNKLRAKLSILTCSVCLCATFAIPGMANTYRWVDDNGVVNYAERKPRGISEDRVTVVAGDDSAASARNSSSSASPVPATGGMPPLDDRQEQMMAELQRNEANRQEQVATIRKDNCERSRRVLNNLSVNNRIRVRAEDGNERVITEEERQQRIAEAQQGIVANCDS